MLKRINFSNIHYVPCFSWWRRNRLKLAFNLGHVKGNFVTICVGKKLGKEVILPRAYSAPKVLVIEVRNWKHKMTWGPKPWVQIIYNGKNLEYGLLSRRVSTQFFCRMLFILSFCCLCNVSVVSASECGSCVLSAGVYVTVITGDSASPSWEGLTKGKRSKRQPFNSFRWPIYVFNSVVNTKLLAILSHRRSTTVSLETYPLYILWKFWLFFVNEWSRSGVCADGRLRLWQTGERIWFEISESQKRWILNLGLKLVQQKHPANTSWLTV